MLGRRLISAAVIVSGLLLLVWLDYQLGTPPWGGRPGIVLTTVAIVVGALASEELGRLLHRTAPLRPVWVPIAITVGMLAVTALPFWWLAAPRDFLAWAMIGMTVGVGLTFLDEMSRFGGDDPPGQVLDRLARRVFGLAYLQILFGFMFAHRALADPTPNSTGLFALVLLIVTVKFSDAAAYFVGKSMGRHRVVPRLSPGKTWEGVGGAILGGIGGAALMMFVIGPAFMEQPPVKPGWWFLVYGVVVTLAGMLGDLGESLIKREAECKDSSSWLPGLGGVLDIADSLVFAAPVSWFLLVLVG